MKERLFWVGLAVAAVIIPLLSLMTGPAGIGWPVGGAGGGNPLLILRIERLWAALAMGAGLAAAGVAFQAILRNPLAEPYVLGVSGGASLGAAGAMSLGVVASFWSIPFAAFIGGTMTLAVVLRLARSDEGPPTLYGLILSGVIVSSVCSGLLMFLLTIAPSERAHSILWWMFGNLQMPPRALLEVGSVLLGLGLAGLVLLAPELDALTLGRETAHYVGVRTERLIPAILLLATLLAAVSVAIGGLIGFVGLVVPHAIRRLAGPVHRRLLPAAAVAGGLFLALSDVVARQILAPRELPVGVITALVGGPFFLALLKRRQEEGVG
jgi:iron complex transport system permease protein